MSVTAADYSRAERFLSWNQDRYVRNAELHYGWLPDGDRLWYRRTNANGATELILIDARSGQRSPAFDHEKLAALLSSPPVPVKDSESLSPDGAWAAFVRDHNVWVRSTSSNEEFQLTVDGGIHCAYAGSPGYSTHAVTDARLARQSSPKVVWSPDSRWLLTHRIDERLVKDLHLMQSVPAEGGARPRLFSYRYALPGDEHLPLLEPVALDVIDRRVVSLSAEPLICSVQSLVEKGDTWWASDSKSIYYLKRARFSNEVGLCRVDTRTGERTDLVRESGSTVVQTNARNIFVAPLVRTLENGDIIWYSQRDGWGHLYYYTNDGTLRNQITKGEWAVRDILLVKEEWRTIFFAANGREEGRDAYEQRIYSVRFDGSGMQLLTPEEANHEWSEPLACTRTDATGGPKRFSPSGKFFLDSYCRPDVPPVHVLRSIDGAVVRELERADISRLQQEGYTPIEPFQVIAADGRTKIYGNLYRPSTFDPGKTYPVIDAIYPGPQIVRTAKTFIGATFGKFILDAQCLAELGFIVVTIDGRGTPGRSREFQDYSYGRLDKASELDDHIAGIRQLSQRYPYMDIGRVGIDGASGGGFAAARALMAYPEFFKVAVSAAGNHDQRGNLAPWAETYIGPLDEEKYALSSTLPLVERLNGKLLLMHGDMDDNVHPSLTMKLVDALIRANKDFDLLIIPGADHSAYATSRYFIRRKSGFLRPPPAGTGATARIPHMFRPPARTDRVMTEKFGSYLSVPNPLFDGWKWKPPAEWLRVTTIDTHTGGEPLRIVTSGLPEIKGRTVIEKRRYFMENLDPLRRGLLREPRGHADMYGAILTRPSDDADLDVFFINTEGYSPMCGHAILAITKVVLETGLVRKEGGRPELVINVPPGRNYARAVMEHGEVRHASFQNVPSFAYLRDKQVDVPGLGSVSFDVAFGGAFYVIVDADSLNVGLTAEHYNTLIDYGRRIKRAVLTCYPIEHPFEPDMSSLFGVIFTGEAHDRGHHSRNVTIFEDGEVDRSATGTGVSARIALLCAQRKLSLNQPITIESILGSTMTVEAVRQVKFGSYDAVIPEVSGSAHIMSRSELYFDPKDPFNAGFIIR